MMLPALMFIGVGRGRRFWLPLPLFLLWPLWLLGWIAWLIMKAVRVPQEKMLLMALILCTRLSGIVIDVDSQNDDANVHIRMI